MKQGDIVMVFKDPLTCLKPEGFGKLFKRFIDVDVPGFQTWYVEFLTGLGYAYIRRIKD
jgi:hypothetical protein